ncbi:MAG TPA: RnfABCDGE type electron transport complex subunit D [Steroidobacteraceae bacterium]|nr:RnfABCDGE type electron transport complex subunit D [Steroidobacteraceae bacterium]
MKFDTAPAPHTIAGYTVHGVMLQVLLALAPVALVHVALFGPGLLLQVAVACVTALLCEALALRWRQRDVRAALRDGSVLVTAGLLALSVTPLLPWWLTALGTAFAVLLGKHAFGGLGQNPFNPAMVGYASLLIAFPTEMTRWPVPLDAEGARSWGDLARLAFTAFYGGDLGTAWDGYSGATALDSIRAGLDLRFTMSELLARGTIVGAVGARGFEWINLAALAGGLYLLARGIVRWHIPVAVLAGLLVPAFVAHALDRGANLAPLVQAFSGATMLGAFFIATDPVSAATSDRGRLWYGAGIGLLTWIIRTWGGYPDGVAFAVLLMNLAVPLLDRYTVPRIYGRTRE